MNKVMTPFQRMLDKVIAENHAKKDTEVSPIENFLNTGNGLDLILGKRSEVESDPEV